MNLLVSGQPLRSALNIFEKHYSDNYFQVNSGKLVKVSYPNSIHQESEVLAGECLPSTGSGIRRNKRNAENECLFTWEEVDEFNEEKNKKRDFSKIRIDSGKFLNYIRDLTEEKRSQLIQLAEKVQVTGESQNLINKLIDNQKVINHLSRVGKISGVTMHGMMAKNILADFLNGDYQGVAVNVGFIAGGQGFAKVAETASLKGLKLAAEGKLLVGSSLRAASPFLARGTSAFVIYDLVNQVKAFKNGTEEALVGIVGDSIYLGVDSVEIGVEVAEAFGVLEGVSSVTGPIGATIGAVVFIGTDIYTAVKRVDKIDQIIHLKGIEKFFEGLRAFIGMQPEQNIEELLEEKQLDNQLVNQGLEYLKQHNDIQRYVFPSGRIVKDFCQYIPYDATRCVRTLGLDGGRCLERRIVIRYYHKCTSKFEAYLNNEVLLDRENPEIKWNRARPNDPSEGKVFCLPQGDYEPAPRYGSYSCKNAIGVTDLSPNKIEGHTLINLGEGKDYAKGFLNSPNIFVVNNGSKEYYGGNKDDMFVLQADYVRGYLSGGEGINTLDTTLFAFQEEQLNIELHIGKVAGSFLDNWFKICEVNQVIGRENKADIITVSCNGCNSNVKLIDGRGGNEQIKDKINIIDDSCSYQMQIIVRANTAIYNQALEGNFDYLVPLNDGGSVGFGFIYDPRGFNVNNTFWFAYEVVDIRSIDVSCVNVLNVTRHQVEFNFVKSDKEFNVTVLYPENYSYRLGNNAEMKVGNDCNLYMLENTNKSVDEIIKEYLVVANRLNKMSFFIQSLLSNETVVIGSGNHEVIHNNPLHKSHLVGNGGENIYVVDSETDNVPEVIIYDVDEENSIDTIDLRNVVKRAKDNFELQVIKSENDLLLRATVEKHEYFTVRLKDGVERYNKAHVIVENVPMRISVDKDEWSLKPQPLIFEKDKEVIVIADQDVEKDTELVTPRKGGNYKFVRSNSNDLMITNAFDFSITKSDLCSITLSRFYETPKMATLSIKFADKEVVLKDHQEEISTAREVNVVKKEHSEQVYNDVFNHAKSSPEVMVSGQPKLMHKHRHEHSRKQIRHRRHHRNEQNLSHAVGELGNQANIAVSSSTEKLSSRINDLFGWIKSSIGGLFNSKAVLPEETLNTTSSASQIDAPIDVNGTIMLLDLLIRKVTGQKYISTADQSISPLEAQGYALNIIKGFEKVVEQAGLKSGVSMHRLNIDYMGMQKEIIRKVMSGKFDEISGILNSHLEKACPGREAGCPGKLSEKRFNEFMAKFNKGLDVIVNQSIQQILHKRDDTLEVNNIEEQQGPRSYLNNTSIQGHSKDKVSTCLSDIGVTQLGGNLNR